MKNFIIYLGITLFAFSTISVASNTTVSGNQKKLNVFSETPSILAVAISKGEIETVKQIIESGTKVNKKINGLTPLMYAARYNKVEIIEYLLLKGADRDIKDGQGFTALKYAELSNAYDAIAVLKTAAVNQQLKITSIDDSGFLYPEPILVTKPSKTIEKIIAEEEQIIESAGFNEFLPLNFAEINKKSSVKNNSNALDVVTL
ncbi:ankyrin repeat domain-containing protein [Flavobacterium nackdongense]|uniref:Ankyrin repeat domain-containing protein n=1 Tax=Flavobacterium nackdongense TaxID=2547394 RepID=A0A4P6YH37_9FLAO|nr:ankyrin repeat domain-containing protein [Flavobacterium nackdongense]QBN20244.1 ankyrin repeat domain-containing protein [Flavobacterium nackdongense]